VTGVEAATCSFAYRGRHSNSENSIVVDFILAAAAQVPGLEWHRGTERGYPDIEMLGPALGDRFWAVDIKVARRRPLRRGGVSRNTNSRITLYTGNTYFKHPYLPWPGALRPFNDYAGHVDILLLYTLNLETSSPAVDRDLAGRVRPVG
jgi:hypothetical protein